MEGEKTIRSRLLKTMGRGIRVINCVASCTQPFALGERKFSAFLIHSETESSWGVVSTYTPNLDRIPTSLVSGVLVCPTGRFQYPPNLNCPVIYG